MMIFVTAGLMNKQATAEAGVCETTRQIHYGNMTKKAADR